ncbi:uncharacterized protein SOCG_04360 [Schizosaccharomyces octosporus yFS286]|uniref:U6 snRNA phosphodiesterase 1 n=1 Tax=Schizosaccharomyces octosporus (strain yFS286) TaxID=483514 RepID=S9PMZ9_SCHOY|nr:uncharacterized protein SOCG_04360 [Schizosaccharomyces octosporus yFS286]EPX70596.1 eukaryotic protein [Schizosaccharomyces octosporus yFS286]
MSLVPYDSSDTESGDEVEANVKDVPKLPEFFHDLYKKKRKTFDSPIFHEGRKRTKAHLEGQWAVQIYLDVEIHSLHKQRIKDIIAAQQDFKSLFISEYGVEKNLHLSLSELFRIPSDERKAVFATWRQECQQLQQRTIKYTLQEVRLLFNDEKTRMFFVLKATFEKSSFLRKLLSVSDKLMKKFEGKALREDFLPHVSIAWAHAKQRDFEVWTSRDRDNMRFIELEALLTRLQSAFVEPFSLENKNAKMLMGNRVFSANFQ